MTRDPVDILERGYELIWRHDDAEGAFSGVAPDFEWIVPGHPEGDVRHGAGPERVLAVVAMGGRGRESGVPVDVRWGQLWTFREGRAAQMVLYWDLQKAFEAAGLRP